MKRETNLHRCILFAIAFTTILLSSNEAICLDIGGIKRLREQHLFRAAEKECIKALNQSDLQQAEAALLTVELLRTYSEWGLDSKQDLRREIWPKGENYVKQFDRRFNESPYAAIVHLQNGVFLNLKATIERIENKVNGDLEYVSARAFSRDAIRSLDATLSEIATIRPSTSAKKGLRASQITQLRHKTRRELGLAHENYSQCFAEGSDDEVAELTQSVEYFEPLARLKSFPKLSAESQLHLARCHRRLGNFEIANKLLSYLEANPNASPQTKMLTAAERTHFHLDRGELQTGLRTAETVFSTPGIDESAIAEYELAKLRALVLICKKNNEPRNSPRNQRAEQASTNIRKRFSLHWQIQAEDYLASINPKAVTNTIGFEREAQRAYRAGQIDEALKLYAEAARMAERIGRPEKSLQLGHTAGAIAHQNKRYREACELLRSTALRFKTQEKAADAHLLAIIDAAQLARSQNNEDIQFYSDLLDEHLRLWPDSTTSNQVRNWYGRLLFQQRKWRGAFDVLIRIDPTVAEFESIVDLIKLCSYQIIDSASPETRNDEHSWLDRQLSSSIQRLSDTNASGVEFAMTKIELLRISLGLELATGTPSVEGRLQEVAQDFPESELEIEANRCLSLYYCNNRRFHDAKNLLNSVSSFDSSGLTRLLNHVFIASQTHSPELRADSAEVMIPIAKELANRKLPNTEQRRTRIILANAYQFSGQRADAIFLAHQLEKEYPRDGEIYELLATLLQDSKNSKEISKAIRAWRVVANGSKPGSDRWFRSKLAVAECYFQIEQYQKAAEVIRLTKALHPNLGGDQLKLQFESLLRKVDRAAKE